MKRGAQTNKMHTPTPKKTPTIYEIRIRGRLDEDWVEWFDNMTLTHTSEGQTILTGPIPDQAALHGTLNRIRDLNLELISVTQTESAAKDESQARSKGGTHTD
jgi:hypothetical protein